MGINVLKIINHCISKLGQEKVVLLRKWQRLIQSINYLGIELQESVIVSALDRLIEAEVPNVKLLKANAMDFHSILKKGKSPEIYLNFSDPWPKVRHEKRRLTYKGFLQIYEDTASKSRGGSF